MKTNQYKDHIECVLEKMGSVNESFNSEDAIELVLETAITESGRFEYLKQIQGPAVGFTQLEPDTIKDCWDNYIIYRNNLTSFILSLGFNPDDMEFSVWSNLALQIAFTRIWYYRRPGKIPSTIEERAEYWKKHYNTELGKGTVEHYLRLNGVI